MNIKKKSIIIPAFTLLIGAALAGSVSGTVAWYQYSTRVNTAYVGVSAGESGNLQVKLANGEWSTRITFDQIDTYLSNNSIGQKFAPITSGEMDKDDDVPAKFYRNPIAGHGPYAEWEEADETNYVTIPLKLRYVERVDGVETDIARKIYLSDLTIQKDPLAHTDKDDISEAVRVHIECGAYKHLISLSGGSIDTNGKLDLDADGHDDEAYNGTDKKYGFDGGTLEPITYGAGEQEAYAVNDLLVTPNDSNLKLANVDDSKIIGITEDGGVDMTITIWVEGWQELSTGNYPSLWSSKLIESSFDVGFEFAVDPEE